MNRWLLISIYTFLSVSFLRSTQSFAHDAADERVKLVAEYQGGLQASDKIQFNFQLFDDVEKKSIPEADLQDSHTKKLHLIVYDQALKEFNHTHPIFDGKGWNAELNLKVNGDYFIWAQGKLTDGTEFSAVYRTKIKGGANATPVSPLGDHRVGLDGLTKIELTNNKITSGNMVMINYSVTRTDGSAPDVTPYLGAAAHIIAVSPDGASLIHVHPMDGSSMNSGMIHAVFPTDGDYRIWIQLNDHGELKTLPLSVTVYKNKVERATKTSSKIGSKPGLDKSKKANP